MALTETPSPHVELRTPPRRPPREQPSPLRIVKRGRRGGHGHDAGGGAVAGASPTELADSRLSLKVVKRRARRQAPAPAPDDVAPDPWEPDPGCRPGFWASSAELGRPRGRAWEQTLTRRRGLLARSTPLLRDARQSSALGRLGAQRRARSCRTASPDSSLVDLDDQTPSNGPTTATPPLDSSRAAQPFVLSPHIAVVSQPTGQDAARQSVWATVEVSGRLSRIPSSPSPSGGGAQPSTCRGSFVHHQLDRFFEFGCLYDLDVEILTAADTTIVQVVQEQAFPTTIHAGSSVILLVHVQLDADAGGRRGGTGHVRQRSDELMEDLELELGSSAAGLMHIRVSYSHSAFPEQTGAEPETAGVFGLRSRMETTATARLTRRRTAPSVWSPRPEPLESHKLPLVQRHWGSAKALSVKSLVLGRDDARRRRLQGTPPGSAAGADDAGAEPAAGRAACGRRVGMQAQRGARASTLGRADGGRAQWPPSGASPSTPPPRRGRRSPGHGRGEAARPDPPSPGADGSLQGEGRARVGSRRGADAPVETWGAAGPADGREAGRGRATRHGEPARGTGFWDWGLWF